MRQRMLITDVARMHSGLCIAGYSDDLRTAIRPVLPDGGGLPWDSVVDRHGSLLRPFSVVSIDLLAPRPDSPHTEDWLIQPPLSIEYHGRALQRLIERALRKLTYQDILQAFDNLVVGARFIWPGVGNRSLVTVEVDSIDYVNVRVSDDSDRVTYRLKFCDRSGAAYDLPVTDVGFRAYCDYLGSRGESPDRVGAMTRHCMSRSESLFLRIGLSRPFARRPGDEARCFLMVTGVHTIPDFLPLSWDSLFPNGGR